MYTRICVAVGPWQLIMLSTVLQQVDMDKPVSAARQDILVLAGTADGSTNLGRLMEQIAKVVWPWKRIVWATDAISKPGWGRRWDNHLYRSDLAAIISRVRDTVGVDTADELFVSKLHVVDEKLIAESYPQASIVLYEDGLQNYIQWKGDTSFSSSDQGIGLPFLPPVISGLIHNVSRTRRVFRGYESIHSSYLQRLSSVFLFIAKDLGVPDYLRDYNVKLIEDSILRNTVALCEGIPGIKGADIEKRSPNNRSALILGQCYSTFHPELADSELELYTKMVGFVLGRNYTVYWKDHPRLKDPFYPKIKNQFGDADFHCLSIDSTAPIEIVAPELNLSCCVSVNSSSLFYLKRLYGIDVFAFDNSSMPGSNEKRTYLDNMIRRVVPDIMDMPDLRC